MQQVILFGTDGCHLCEMALELLLRPEAFAWR